jgi:hypothetical protein
MPTIRVQLQGFDAWRRALDGILAAVHRETAAQLTDTAEHLLAVSQQHYVPVDSGRLHDSGRVDPGRMDGQTVEVTLGYHTDYALIVHENPRAGKTEGRSPRGRPYRSWAPYGQWKYLETPVTAGAAGVADDLAAAVRRGLP